MSSSADMEKQANGPATPPEITVGLENNNINEEGKLELDTEKGHIGEAGPKNKTGPAPELPSAFRRFTILGAVCLGIFLVSHPISRFCNL
jgi:hypothetical protein